MKQTQNYGLNKPDKTDYAKIELLNENADKIDAAIKEAKDAAENIDLTNIEQSINNVKSQVTTHLEEKATLTTFGHTRLSNDTNSASEVMSATPKAVKQVNDKFKLPAPVKLVLAAGWQPQAGEEELKYYKDAFGVVNIYGLVEKKTGGSDLVSTIPVGFRPSTLRVTMLPSSGVLTRLIAMPDGKLRILNMPENSWILVSASYPTT